MKVVRTLTLPGRREYESSTITVELSSEDLPPQSKQWSVQQRLWWLTKQTQAHVLYVHASDNSLHSSEVMERMATFMKETPHFLLNVENIKIPPEDEGTK